MSLNNEHHQANPFFHDLTPMHLSVTTLILLSFCRLGISLSFRTKPNFAWSATLKRDTAIASSTETSQLILPSHLISGSLDRFRSTSEEFVDTWAEFLCQGSVTLGMFRAKHDPIVKTTSIRLRGIPINLLTFGAALQRRGNCWEIPILPSWLALPNNCSSRNGSANHHHGSLVFDLSIIERRHSDIITTDSRSNGGCLRLETRIKDYHPWLAGNSPVPRARQWLYLNTQSLTHAYITLRFHKAWRKKLIDVIAALPPSTDY